jgi:hypothetical protein
MLGVLGAALAARAQDPQPVEAPQPLGTIVKAKGAITMDGKLNEADWKNAKPIAVKYVRAKKNVIGEQARMNVRYLWDEGYLYLGYEVFDTNLVARSSGVLDGPENNRRMGCLNTSTNAPVDLIEFLIVFEDRNFFWQLQLNASNQFNDALCVAHLPSWSKARIAFTESDLYWAWHEFVQDEGERTLASAIALTPRPDGTLSTVNNAADVDTGYTGELRLPWYGIGAPSVARSGGAGVQPGSWNMQGREISILAVVQDGDDPAHSLTTAPATTIDFLALQADRFPRYTLRAAGQWAW